MVMTCKLGKLIRKRATPFQIFSAFTLGMLIGFVPGFQKAPKILKSWIGCLINLNANLFLAGLVGILGKLLLIALTPEAFTIAGFTLKAQPTRYSLLSGMVTIVENCPR